MDDELVFDVYVQITDPPWKVVHEAVDSRVSVVIGGPPSEPPPRSLLQLWFKDPEEAVQLGRDLITESMKLAAQLQASESDTADSGPGSVEDYPVPGKKPNTVELGDES